MLYLFLSYIVTLSLSLLVLTSDAPDIVMTNVYLFLIANIASHIVVVLQQIRDKIGLDK